MDIAPHRNIRHRTCSYYACVITSANSPESSFHRIPTNRDRARQWIEHINQPSFHFFTKEQLSQKTVCNVHFPVDSFDHLNQFERKLHKNAVPIKCQKPSKQLEIEKYNEENGNDPFAIETTDSVPYIVDLDYKSLNPNDNHQHPFFSALKDTKYLSPKESWLDIPAIYDITDNNSCSSSPSIAFTKRSEPTPKLRSHNFRPTLEDIYDNNNTNSVNFQHQEDSPHENANLCRICAEKHDDLIEIFSDESLQKDLCEKINTLLPIEVTQSDVLPVQVCHSCVENLETAYQLRETCAIADTRLRVMFEQNIQPNEAMDNSFCIEDASEQEMSPPMEDLHADTEDSCRWMTVLHPQVPIISTPQLFCHACNLEIPIASVFVNHMNYSHRQKIMKCQYCFTFFASSQGLSDHILELHEDRADDAKIAIRLKRKEQRLAKLRKTKLFCKTCKLQFPFEEKKEYLKHISKHKAEIKAQQLANAKIVCDYCDKRFLTDRSKKFHMSQTHGQYKPFSCTLCSKTFHLKQSLVSHLGVHNQAQGLLCEICAKTFSSKHSLTAHIRSSHDKKLCSICGRECSSARFRKHMDAKHLSERKVRCDDCGHSFYTVQELCAHKSRHNTFPFRCYICGGIYRLESTLYSHMQSHKHIVSKSFICPVLTCRSQFESTRDIIQHCDTHDKQDLPKLKILSDSTKIMTLLCTYCNSSFRKLPHYTHHLKRQHSFKTNLLLTCNICKSDWPDEPSFTDHLETHPEAFDFSCRHCLQTFVSDTQRTNHENLAHGRSRQCHICFKILRNNNQLSLHKKLHDSIQLKTVSCLLCDKMFYDKKGLSKHKRTHQEKHLTCDVCKKMFRWQHDLKKHYYLLHTNEKMYKCDDCEFSSNTLKDVEKHKYIEHDAELSLPSDSGSD